MLRMMDGLAAPKKPPLMKMSRLCDMCDRKQDLRSIASRVGISFRAAQSILTDILGISKVLARWVPRMLTDDQKRTWLDISCVAMKMLPAILSSKL